MKTIKSLTILLFSFGLFACSKGGFTTVDSDLDNSKSDIQNPSTGEDPTNPNTPSNPSNPSAGSSVQINWTPPTTRTNNAPLSIAELKEYRIYFRSADGLNSEQTLVVTGGASNSAIISNLANKEWIFSLTAVDTGFLESDRSSEIRVTTVSGKTTKIEISF